MKRIILIIIVSIYSVTSFSQNLVKNPGFEELKAPYTHPWICSESFNKFVSNWLSISLISAEIYKYDSSYLKIASDSSYFNMLPPQHSGNYLVAIKTYGTNNINEPLPFIYTRGIDKTNDKRQEVYNRIFNSTFRNNGTRCSIE